MTGEAHAQNASGPWSEEHVQALIDGLESLREGRLASAALVGCGPPAVAPLRKYLLEGRPRGIFQPRQLAVETLAELGASQVLIEYLRTSREIPDPVVRLAEEAVQNTAARLLARWRTEEVFEALRDLARTELFPGLVEALGSFDRPEMIAYYLGALADDFCRRPAEEALARLGEAARPELLAAAVRPIPCAEMETTSSKIRRRVALRLLLSLKLFPGDWTRLRDLLRAPDPEISLRAAQVALAAATGEEQGAAVRRLIAAFSQDTSHLQWEAQYSLRTRYDVARPEIESEIERRRRQPHALQQADITLRALLAIQKRAAGSAGSREVCDEQPERGE